MDIENLKEKFEEKHGSFNFKIIDHYDFWLLSEKTLKDIEDACRENFSDFAHCCRYPESFERYFGKTPLIFREDVKRKLYYDIMFKSYPRGTLGRKDEKKECLEKAIERLRFFRLVRYGKTEESKLFTLDIDDYEEKYRYIRERELPF